MILPGEEWASWEWSRKGDNFTFYSDYSWVIQIF